MKTESRGYTLVELMVAMVLGLLLVGATFGVYSSGRQAGRYSDALGRYQESVRYAQAVISDELRMAGFFGCLQVPVTTGTTDMASMDKYSQPVNVGLGADQSFTRPVFGFEGNSGGPSHIAGTDVVQVQHASREGAWLSATTTSTATQTSVNGSSFLNAGGLGVIASCAGASVFSVIAVGAAGAGHTVSHSALGNSYGARGSANPGQIFEFLNRFIYVRDVNGRSVLTLRTVRGDAVQDDDIAEGIEDLQFWYGYDPAPLSSQIENHQLRFLKADEVADTVPDWRRVVSVKACMLSVSADRGLSAQGSYTDCQGNSATSSDGRLRFPVSFTVNLRNRVQG